MQGTGGSGLFHGEVCDMCLHLLRTFTVTNIRGGDGISLEEVAFMTWLGHVTLEIEE
jgi:hypothetical protein